MTDPDAIDAVLRSLDPPVWLVTARAGERRGGLVATFVNPASIVPEMPRVVVGVAKQHHTWDLVEASGAFVLHLLGEDQLDLAWRFGLASGRDADKLAGLDLVDGVRLAGVPAWLECRVEAGFDTGDRTLYLAEVVAGRRERDVPPLTLQRLLARTPPDRMAQLRDGLRRDAQVDAAAIRSWRGRDVREG